MSDDLVTTIAFKASEDGFGTVIGSMKRSIFELGETVKKVSENTSKELDKITVKDGASSIEKATAKTSKAVIKRTGELQKEIATFASTASTGLKSAYESIEQAQVRLSGIDAKILDPYLAALKEVRALSGYVSDQQAKAAQEQEAATRRAIADENHWADLKRQHAAYNKTIADQQAASLREELALVNSINEAALNRKYGGSAKPSAYYQEKAGTSASPDVSNALANLRAQEQAQLAVNRAAAAKAAIDDKAAKDLREQTAAFTAFRTEVQNAELNLVHFGRAKSAAMLADKGARLGFDPAAVQAELAALQKIEAANKAAFQAANPHIATLAKQAEAAGISVKGLNANLRQVPAQFTDIIVSLQGGQAPLTVLLQQGGQLKDLFGGVGNAARALGGYVVGLINPFTIAAGAVALLATAYLKGAAEGEAFNKSLIETGNYAGTTAAELTAMAGAISQSNGSTITSAADALAALAANGGIAASQFSTLGSAAVAMQKATGVAVADTVKQFAELGKEPLTASVKLNESTNYLTESVYKQIKALMDQGDTLQAGVVAQNAWASAIEQRAPALIENLGYIESAWRKIASATKAAISAAADIGRTEDPTAALKSQMDALVAKMESRKSASSYNPQAAEAQLRADTAILESLKQQLGYAGEIDRVAKRTADTRAEEARGVKARVEFDKTALEYSSKQEKMARAIAEARGKFDALPNKSAEDIEKYARQIAGIQDRFKETEKHAKSAKKALVDTWDKSVINEYAQAMDKIFKVQLKAEESAEGLSKTQTALREVQAGPQWEKFSRQMQEQIIYSASLSQGAEDQAKKVKELADSQKELAKARTSATQSHVKELESINDKAQKLEDEVTLYGKSKQAIEELTTARMLDQIEVLKGFENSAEEIARIKETIVARQRLAAAGTAKDAKDDAVKAAKEISDANKKAAEESGKYWEDALMRAFESGKGFFQSLWDTIKNTLKTQVLKVLIQGVGIGGATGAMADSGSGLLSMANTLSNLPTAISGLTSAVTGLWAGATAAGSTAAGAASAGLAYSGSVAAGAGSSFLAGSSLSSTLAAIPGWGWAALGVAAVAGLVSSNKFTSAATTGVTSSSYAASGALISKAGEQGTQAQLDAAYKNADALAKNYFETAAKLGIKAIESVFHWGTNSGKEGKNPNTSITVVAGEKTYRSGEVSNADQAALNNMTAQALFTALQASELPKYLAGAFDGMDAAAMTADQISNVLAGAQALASFHKALQGLPFEGLADLSFLATQNLIGFSGGLEQFSANLSGFYQGFYSEAERTAQLTSNTSKAFAELGQTMPAVDGSMRDWYRSMIEVQLGLDQSDPAIAKVTAGLLGMQGAVNELAPAFETIAVIKSSIAGTTEAIKNQAEWQTRLDIATGATTDREIEKAAALAAADDATDALINRLYALEDAAALASRKTAIIDKYTPMTLEGAKSALPAGFADAFAAMGTEAAKQWVSSYTATLSSPAYIAQVEQLGTALDTLFASMDASEARLKGFADEAAQLSIELLNAQGNTAGAAKALRELETNGFNAAEIAAYDYNKSLRNQITAINDAKASLESFNTAAVSIRGSQDTISGTSAVDAAQRELSIALNNLNQEMKKLPDVVTTTAATTGSAAVGFFEMFPDALAYLQNFSTTEKDAFTAYVNSDITLIGKALNSPEWANRLYDLVTTNGNETIKAMGAAWIDPDINGIVKAAVAATKEITTITTGGVNAGFSPFSDAQARAIGAAIAAGTVSASDYTTEQVKAIQAFMSNAAALTTAQTAAATATASEATKTADAIQAITDGLTKESKSLGISLLEAEGKFTEAKDAAKTLATKGMDPLQIAMWVTNEATRTQIATLTEQKTLQDELNGLRDTEAQALTRQRNALDESNRALFDQVQGFKTLASLQSQFAVPQTAAQASAAVSAAGYNVTGMDTAGIASYISGILNAPGMLDANGDLTASGLATVASINGLADSLKILGTEGDKAAEQLKTNAATQKSLNEQISVLNGALTQTDVDRKNTIDALAKAGDTASIALQTTIWGLQDLKDAAQITSDYNRAMIDASGSTTSLEAFDKAISDAALITAGWTQAQIDAVDATKAATKTAAATKDYNRAMLEASFDNQGLKAFDRAIETSARLLAGWTPQQIDALNNVIDSMASVDAALSALVRATEAEKTSIRAAADADIKALQASGESKTDAIKASNESAIKSINDQIAANNAASDAASKLASSLSSMLDAITSATDTLRNNVMGDAMSMTNARAYIDMSLSLARAGASPDAGKLGNALSVVTGDSMDNYSTLASYKIAQGVQAGKLEELGKLTSGQLSNAEAQIAALEASNKIASEQIDALGKYADTQIKAINDANDLLVKSIGDAADAQIKALDDQLLAAQNQVDALKGIDTSVISVKSAIDNLSIALTGYDNALTGGAGATVVGPVTNSIADIQSFSAFNQSGSDNSIKVERLEALLEVVIAELAKLKEPADNTAAATKKLANQFESVTESGRAMQTEVYA